MLHANLSLVRGFAAATLSSKALVVLSSLAMAACGGAASPRSPGYAANVPFAPGDGRFAESFQPQMPRQHGSASLVLPGATSQELIHYEVVGGVAVYEGDIVLGPVASLQSSYGAPAAGSHLADKQYAMATSNKGHLWPNGEIPYEIDGSVSAHLRGSIEWAVQQANQTALKVRPRVATDRDYVVFHDPGEGCNSHVGRAGGAQTINITTGCGRGGALHELLHAAGFWHEQSRGDRDNYVTIMWEDITPGREHAFEKRNTIAKDMGPYDYGSIMHYGGNAFSRTGRPTIVPKTPGARIGQRETMSVLDKAAIAQLYTIGATTAQLPIPGWPAELPIPWLTGGTPPPGGTPAGSLPIPAISIPGVSIPAIPVPAIPVPAIPTTNPFNLPPL